MTQALLSRRFLHHHLTSLPSLSPEVAKASKASVSTLPSGLIVVTEDASTTSTVTMTYPMAGSGSEMLGEEGAALINKCLAFKSGSGLSTVLINRSIENEGATPFAFADRSGTSLGYTVEPENAIGLVPLLALDCTFEKWDVRDARVLAAYQISEANKSVEIVLTEQIFAAAYGASSPMGRPFFSNNAGTYEVASFRSRVYGVNGAILAATGVKDHAAFCTEVDSVTAQAPRGVGSPVPTASYIGGEARLSAPSIGYAHVALAFEAKVASPIRNVIKQCFRLVGKEAGVSAFSTGGLVGVYAGAPSDGAGALDAALTETLTAKLTPDIIAKAKVMAKAEATFALDCGSKGLAAAMTAAVLETGSFTDAATVAKSYDSIADVDVTSAVSTMLKSNPSLAAVGDIGVVPYQGTYASRF
jgi:predicted Zn-dependent peptidase